jgi:hypothetical protein
MPRIKKFCYRRSVTECGGFLWFITIFFILYVTFIFFCRGQYVFMTMRGKPAFSSNSSRVSVTIICVCVYICSVSVQVFPTHVEVLHAISASFNALYLLYIFKMLWTQWYRVSLRSWYLFSCPKLHDFMQPKGSSLCSQ